MLRCSLIALSVLLMALASLGGDRLSPVSRLDAKKRKRRK